MFWKWFWKVLAILLILSIVAVGGIAIYQIGFTQGAVIEIQSINTNMDIPATYIGFYHITHILLPFIVILFFLALFLIMIGGIRRHYHYRLWKSSISPTPEEIRQHWNSRRYHHHCPGRCWNTKEGDQEKSDENGAKDDKVVDADPG